MLNNKKQILYKTNQISVIELVFLIIMLSIFLLPAMQQTIKFYMILALGVLFVGVHTLLTREQYGIKILIGAMGIAFLFYLLGDVGNIIEMISKLYYYFISCFPAILLCWFIPRSSEKQCKIVMIIATFLFLYVLRNTYQELLINENATRSFQEALERNADNIGTYDYVYASGTLVPFLGIVFIHVKKRWKKILAVIFIVLELYFLLIAQYTIALLAAVITLGLVPILREKRKQVRIIYCFILCIVILCMSPILEFVAQRVPSEQMAIRLMEVANFLRSGEVEGYNLGGRMTLYGQALGAFFDHPITGNRVLNFNSHSTILGVMARLGIWGILVYGWMLKKMKKKTEKVLGIKEDKWEFTPIFVYLMIMGMTNPIHSALITNAMVWFVIPLGLCLLNREKKDVALEN